jgi:hypothetical protein
MSSQVAYCGIRLQGTFVDGHVCSSITPREIPQVLIKLVRGLQKFVGSVRGGHPTRPPGRSDKNTRSAAGWSCRSRLPLNKLSSRQPTRQSRQPIQLWNNGLPLFQSNQGCLLHPPTRKGHQNPKPRAQNSFLAPDKVLLLSSPKSTWSLVFNHLGTLRRRLRSSTLDPSCEELLCFGSNHMSARLQRTQS